LFALYQDTQKAVLWIIQGFMVRFEKGKMITGFFVVFDLV